jgi:acetaldehyde dehydrogenase (acetylating)
MGEKTAFIPPTKAEVEAAIRKMEEDVQREMAGLRAKQRQRMPHCPTCHCWELP